eukprot:5513173-Amphidinium_carterae.1
MPLEVSADEERLCQLQLLLTSCQRAGSTKAAMGLGGMDADSFWKNQVPSSSTSRTRTYTTRKKGI